MVEKMEKIRAKLPWLFSSHYKIERFGITFFLAVAIIAACFGSAFHVDAENKRDQLGDQVMYTTAFSMSLSRASGTVADVRVSEDKTKCFVMLKWDDMKNVVADAGAYSVYLSGANQKGRYRTILCRPTATVYMFGASGYMGIYLVDTNGFPGQILSMTLRSENNFISADGPIADAQGDKSFLEHDQARIYFNPGGASGKTVDCLEDGEMTPFNIYYSFFAKEREQEIRKSMQEKLDAMYEQALIVDNAIHVLLPQTGLQPPRAPGVISELNNVAAPYESLFDFDEKGEVLDLHDAADPGNAVKFDWRSGSIWQGYSQDVLSSYGFRDLASLLKARSGLKAQTLPTDVTWYDVSGVEYRSSVQSASPAEANRNTAIRTLTTAWQDYYEAKKAYMADLPIELLTLERDVKESVDLYTVKTDDVIRLY